MDNLAPVQMETTKLGACLANGDDFGMGGWIVPRSDLVPAFRDDAAVFDDYGAKWPAAASIHVPPGKFKRSPHECPFDHDRSIRSPEWFDASSLWSAVAIAFTP